MNRRPAARAAPFLVGGATALALGLYASVHEPTGRSLVLTGFESTAGWKSALASLTVLLFVVQVSLGLRITGRVGPRVPPPAWTPALHRLVGTVAFGFSIPVVFHCIWALGYQADDTRVLVHSTLGCVAYGLYVAEVMTVRRDDAPRWAIPVLGSVLGVVMLVVWWSSALVHYAEGGA